MPRLIKNGTVAEDLWTLLEKSQDSAAEEVPAGKVIVPLSVWAAQKNNLSKRPTESLGVWINSDEEPESLQSDIDSFAVIAVNFPSFADGRGYSYARLLRERFKYTGELRAIGDVLTDQLFFMKRCGFDSFLVRADRDADRALSGLDTFKEVYQSAVDQPEPLFRRRS